MGKLKHYVPGVLMIMMGILIMAVPEVLVVFVSASLVVVGISLMYLGHMARKSDAAWADFHRSTSYVRFSRDPFRYPFSWWY
jgi:hypothetical protein